MDYEQWTLSEIGRLRAVAKVAEADAETLQRALNRWREAGGRKVTGAPDSSDAATTPSDALNGHPPKRGKQPGYGDKNALAFEKIKAASPAGLTIDELYKSFVETYGPKYKRSSMRALLWHQSAKAKKIELRDGRYVAKETAG